MEIEEAIAFITKDGEIDMDYYLCHPQDVMEHCIFCGGCFDYFDGNMECGVSGKCQLDHYKDACIRCEMENAKSMYEEHKGIYKCFTEDEKNEIINYLNEMFDEYK
jgi:hypothetical protein